MVDALFLCVRDILFIQRSTVSLLSLGNRRGKQNQKKMQSQTTNVAPCAATWRTGRSIHVIFHSGPFAPLCEIMMLYTELKSYNMLHCRQRNTKPRPQRTCTGNLDVWILDVSRHTYIQACGSQYFGPLPEVK